MAASEGSAQAGSGDAPHVPNEPTEGEPPKPAKRAPVLLRTLLRLVGPILLVVVLARVKDRGAVMNAVKAALGWQLAVALALNFAITHVKVLRWNVLLRARGIAYPMKRAWLCFLATSYVGLLTPGRVGDVLRVHYLRHDLGVSYAEGLASIVVDRVCDLYVLAAFVALAIVRFRDVFADELAIVTWVTMALTVLGPLLLFIPGLAEPVAKRIYSKLARGAGAEEGFTSFLTALRASVGKVLVVAIPLTVLAFCINYLQGFLLAQAMGMKISFYDVGCLLAIASLLGLLPISVSGLGVRELLYSLAFPLLGYTASDGVGFGLVVFAVLYLCVVLMGFVGWQLAPPPLGMPAGGIEVKIKG